MFNREEARVNKYVLISLVGVLTGISQGAGAQYPAKSDAPVSPWYIGIGIGVTNASIPGQTVDAANASLTAANVAAFSVLDKDESSTAAKLFLGYRFNPYIAVEGGYAELGNTSVHMDFRSGGAVSTSRGTFDMEYKMSAPFVDAVGTLPLNDKWSLIGRAGVAYGKTRASLNGSPTTILLSSNNKSENKVREKFGAGMGYNINAAFAIRAEWERYKMPDPLSNEVFNVDSATLSVLYHF